MALRSGQPKVRSFEGVTGEWIRVPLTTEAWPVHVQIGSFKHRPVFLDFERSHDGQRSAVAAFRCPELQPGQYQMKVFSPNEIISAVLMVA